MPIPDSTLDSAPCSVDAADGLADMLEHLRTLKNLGAPNWLHATLEVKAPARDGIGLHGSGMFIINSPWTLERKLHETLPALTAILAQGDGARYTLESQSA